MTRCFGSRVSHTRHHRRLGSRFGKRGLGFLTLPDETAAFKPGPISSGAEQLHACHSADYINTQARGPKFKKDFWQAEVTR